MITNYLDVQRVIFCDWFGLMKGKDDENKSKDNDTPVNYIAAIRDDFQWYAKNSHIFIFKSILIVFH